MIAKLWNVITSLRLTVVCLALGTLLVFVGTLAQVHEGLYQAQARFFRSWLIHGLYFGPERKIPVILPGGYLLGTVLLVNLIGAHFSRFKWTKKKIGIWLTHVGIILLLLGQLLTDLLSVESGMRLGEGETKNYSQDFRANELVVIDTSDPKEDQVVTIPEAMLAGAKELRHEKLPVTLRIKNYWGNSDITNQAVSGAVAVNATHGQWRDAFVLPLPPTATMDSRNLPSAIVEVASRDGQTVGTFFVSSLMNQPQAFTIKDKSYALALRFTRYYKPHTITLLDFRHDKYKGTDIPKNFSSRIRVRNPQSSEDREVDIYMNNPLRYAGETYYQSGFDERDPTVTILQVVRNPGWLTPYLACALVFVGMLVQFLTHLIGFAMKRRTA